MQGPQLCAKQYVFDRGVALGGTGVAMAPPFWQISSPYLKQGDRLCPPNYYWHPRIFRPSDGFV